MSKPSMPDFRRPDFLVGHIRRTLSFYDGRCRDATGGFFHFFKDDGTVYDKRTRHLVSSTRFVFNHAMAFRRFGDAAYQQGARHGLQFLRDAHLQSNGGYAWQIDWDGKSSMVLDATNHCYGLAFVVLAYAHATMAGIAEARNGLHASAELMERHFWEPSHDLYADEADAQWRLADYRGQNANMHGCEAMMAAFDATRDAAYLRRALTLAEAITQRQANKTATEDGSLVWEHYRTDWSVDWDYHRDNPRDLFRPWGFQVGHLTEWAKLLLQLETRLPSNGRPTWLLPTAKRFFDTAMRIGWDDVHGGLAYGFSPDGRVCDADKYFWVQAESFAAAALLALRTGDDRYWQHYDRLWAFSWQHMIDHRYGAWYRIRKPDNSAYSDEKSPAGKTDYHTMGACYDVLLALGA